MSAGLTVQLPSISMKPFTNSGRCTETGKPQTPACECVMRIAGPIRSSSFARATAVASGLGIVSAYEASVVHAGKRGTVLIACSEAGLARPCLDYLKAYFEDQPHLAALVKRIGSDEFTLHGNLRILVTTSPRRPKDLLAAITLAPKSAVPVEVSHDIRNSFAAWARHKGYEPAKHHQLIIDEIEGFLKSDDEVLLLFAPPGSAKSTYVSVLLPRVA